jgi:hypothetical protein
MLKAASRNPHFVDGREIGMTGTGVAELPGLRQSVLKGSVAGQELGRETVPSPPRPGSSCIKPRVPCFPALTPLTSSPILHRRRRLGVAG